MEQKLSYHSLRASIRSNLSVLLRAQQLHREKPGHMLVENFY